MQKPGNGPVQLIIVIDRPGVLILREIIIQCPVCYKAVGIVFNIRQLLIDSLIVFLKYAHGIFGDQAVKSVAGGLVVYKPHGSAQKRD